MSKPFFSPGVFLHYPLSVANPCPKRHISFSDKEWKPLDIPELADPENMEWKLNIRPANLLFDAVQDTVRIKLARDSKEDKLFSAALRRSADYKNGGTYEVSKVDK